MDILANIRQPVEQELLDYRRLFEQALTHTDGLLHNVLGHIRQRRGKMMRPILLLLVNKALGLGVTETALRAAVTLELLHTASLVHDDVVDESGERRGQRSVNAAYGNQVAVLVGDFLLSEALSQSALTQRIDMVGIIAQLGKTLSGGELLQLSNIADEAMSQEAYFRIISQKTAALFAACAQLGAMAADASPSCVEEARRLGEIIGICFQIRDDIFDYYNDPQIGKPTAGTDMAEGKLTLPILYALQAGADESMCRLAASVKRGEASAADIDALVAYAKRNGGIDYARQQMQRRLEEGLRLVDRLADGDVAAALRTYLRFVVERDR